MPSSKVHPVHPGKASYESYMLSLVPLHYWRLLEVDGTAAADLGSGASNGTYIGTPTLGSTPLLSRDSANSTYFDGSVPEYVSCGGLGTFGSNLGNGITVSFWVQSSDTLNLGRWCGAINTGTNNTAFTMGLNNTAQGKIFLILRDDDSKAVQATTNAGTGATDGARHHVMVTALGSTNTITIYVDGVSQAFTYSAQTTPANFANFDVNWFISSVNNQGTPALSATGNIQEFAIWNSIQPQPVAEALYLIGINGA